MAMTKHKVFPMMYGLWNGKDWLTLNDGSVFHTPNPRVAEAQRHMARYRQGLWLITGMEMPKRRDE